MTDPPEHAQTSGALMRRWENLWIAALGVLGVSGLLRWVVLPPGGTPAEIAKGVQIAAVIVGIGAVFRWAVLRERQKSSGDEKPQDA